MRLIGRRRPGQWWKEAVFLGRRAAARVGHRGRESPCGKFSGRRVPRFHGVAAIKTATARLPGTRIFKSSVEMAGKLAYNKAKKLGGTVLAGPRRRRMTGKTGPRTGAGK